MSGAFDDLSRAEHMALCKRRALEYVDAGQLDNALASMLSDLSKHRETADLANRSVLAWKAGLLACVMKDAAGVRAFIEEFR